VRLPTARRGLTEITVELGIAVADTGATMT
jgi:hypothetical protein